jgi:hypothetical protein
VSSYAGSVAESATAGSMSRLSHASDNDNGESHKVLKCYVMALRLKYQESEADEEVKSRPTAFIPRARLERTAR